MSEPGARSLTPAIVVYAIWAAMLTSVLVAIALWTRNLPMSEDWIMVAPLTGNEPNLLKWLWAQNNEHRMPVPRLLYLLVLKTGGGDFRSGMVFNALILATIALAMMRLAQRLRGGVVHYTDAFFPVIFMNLGHWENMMWGWQIQFTTSVGLTCALLLVVARQAGLPSPRAAVAAATCLVLLPLSGANGVVIAVAFAPWLAFLGWRILRAPPAALRPRWSGTVLIVAAAIAVLVVPLYFLGYERTRWYAPSPGVLGTATTTAKLIAFGLGPAVSRAWPLFIAAVAVLLLASVLLLLMGTGGRAHAPSLRALHFAPDWPRRVGLLVFFAASFGLSLAIGWGRSGAPPAPGWGLPVRYALLNVPALCAVYLAWLLYGNDRFRTAITWAMFALALLLVAPNTRAGLYWRDWYVENADPVLRDIAAGEPVSIIAERHQPFLMHWNRVLLASRLEMLQQAQLGPFRQHRVTRDD